MIGGRDWLVNQRWAGGRQSSCESILISENVVWIVSRSRPSHLNCVIAILSGNTACGVPAARQGDGPALRVIVFFSHPGTARFKVPIRFGCTW